MPKIESSEQDGNGISPDHRLRGQLYRSVLQVKAPGVLPKLTYLRAQQHLSREEAARNQSDRLKDLLTHAVAHVPYYRNILRQSGIVNSSGEIQLDQFQNIPLLEKATLHGKFDQLKSDDLNHRNWFKVSSGGSTGETTRVLHDQEFADWARAMRLFFDSWAGYLFGDPKLIIWRMLPYTGGRNSKLWRQMGSIIRNEIRINAGSLSPSDMKELLSRIQADNPKMIFGFPENVYELARLSLKHGNALNSSETIMTSGAVLHPWMRSAIEAAHGAPIFNKYGSIETTGIACECNAHAGLHVCTPLQYVEILRSDGSRADRGEIGEVVVTTLVNYAMPLIRYRIGDMAAWSEEDCSCGRQWPRLREVAGRTRDLFLKRDGTQVRIWEHVFHQHAWIKKFQIIQQDYEIVDALIVPYEDVLEPAITHSTEIRQVEDEIREAMGADCSITVALTDHIDASPSGKFRHHISMVQ